MVCSFCYLLTVFKLNFEGSNFWAYRVWESFQPIMLFFQAIFRIETINLRDNDKLDIEYQ